MDFNVQDYLPPDQPYVDSPSDIGLNPADELFISPTESIKRNIDNPVEQLTIEEKNVEILNIQAEVLELKRNLIKQEYDYRELSWSKDQLESQLAKKTSDMKTLVQREIDLSSENNSLNHKLRELESERREGILAKSKLESQVEFLEATIKKQQEITQTQVEKLQSQLQLTLNDTNYQTQLLLNQLSLSESKFLQLQKSHNLINDNVNDLGFELHNLQSAFQVAEQNMESKNLTIDRLTQELSEAKILVATLTSEKDNMNNMLKSLDSQLSQKRFTHTETAATQTETPATQTPRKSSLAKISNDPMISELEETRRKSSSLEYAYEQASKALTSVESRNEILQSKLCDSQVEIARITRMKAALEDKLAALIDDNKNPDHVKDLIQENVNLKDILYKTEKAAETKLTEGAQQLEAKLQEMQLSIAEHNAKKTAYIDELTINQNQLKTKFEEESKRNIKLEADLRKLIQNEKEYVEDRINWNEEKEELLSRLDNIKNKIISIREEENQINSDRLRLSLELISKNTEITLLNNKFKQEIERGNNHLRNIESLVNEKNSHINVISSLKLTISDLTKEKNIDAEQIILYKNQFQELQWKYSLVQEESTILKSQAKSIAKHFTDNKLILQNHINQFQSSLQNLQSQNLKLQDVIKSQQNAVNEKAQQITELQYRISTAELQLDHTTETLNNTQAELASALNQNKLKTKQIQSLKQHFHILYEQHQSTPALGVETPSAVPKTPISAILANEEQLLQTENTQLQCQLENCRAQNEVLTSQNKLLATQLSSLQTELNTKVSSQFKLKSSQISALNTNSEKLDAMDKLKLHQEQIFLEKQCEIDKMEIIINQLRQSAERDAQELESTKLSYRAVVQAHAADIQQVEAVAADKLKMMETIENLRQQIHNNQNALARERTDFEKYMMKAKSELEVALKTKTDLQRDFDALLPLSKNLAGLLDPSDDQTKGFNLKLKQITRQRDAFADELESARIEAAQLRARNQAVEKAMEQFKAELENNAKTVVDLRRKLSAQALLNNPNIVFERDASKQQLEKLLAIKEAILKEKDSIQALLDQERVAQLPLRTSLEESQKTIKVFKEEIDRLKTAEKTWQKEYQFLITSHRTLVLDDAPIPENTLNVLKDFARTAVSTIIMAGLKLNPAPDMMQPLLAKKRTRMPETAEEKSITKKPNNNNG